MRRLFTYRDLLLTLIARELTVRYKRSSIGFLWTMLQPLLTMLVLHLVFSSIFRGQLENYPVFVLAGLMFWNFFSQSIISSMNSLRSNAALLKKLPVPQAIFPVATVIAGVVNFFLALIPLFGLLLVTGHHLGPSLFFLPVAIAIAAIFTLGAGLLLSPLAVFFYDVVEVVGVLMMLAMYATPIIYPMSILPERYRWFVRFNPLRSILEVFRDPIYYGKIPPLAHLSVALAVAVAAFVIGAWSFHRSADRIPFYV
ncbi:MAG TPA: ABC transporter permease [Thermoanaerobaculia bacterium]|jgi:ABC-type polysaccharide/polyol phosphate export permease|nr:ABC transporter permease [Thermoanaerobaculia bacterium]